MRLSKKLIKQAKKLSPGERLQLAISMFDNGGDDIDNYHQIIIYTGLKDRGARVVRMSSKDFE
jgi:hypothetical protein